MAEAKVTLGMDTRPFEKGAAKATSTIDSISVFAAAKFAAIQSVVGKAMDAASQVMQAAAQRVQASLVDSMQKAGEVTALKETLSGIYKNANTAASALRTIGQVASGMDLARSTAFAIGESLAKAGVKASELGLAVGVIGNISSAYGVSAKALGDVYGTVFQRGSMAFAEMNALTQAGIPIQQQLARQMGLGFADVAKLAERGGVSANEFTKAMRNMGASDARGTNNSAMQSAAVGAGAAALDTFDGKLRKIQETAKNVVVDLMAVFVGGKVEPGKGPLDQIKNGLKPILDVALNAIKGISAVMAPITLAIQGMVSGFGQGPSLIESMSAKLKAFLDGSEFLKTLPARVAELAIAARQGVAFVLGAIQNGDLLNIIKTKLLETFADVVNPLVSGLISGTKKGFEAASEAVSSVVEGLGNGIQKVSGLIASVTDPIRESIRGALSILTDPDYYIAAGSILFDRVGVAISALKKMMADFADSAGKYLSASIKYAIQEIGNAWKGDSTLKWLIGEKIGIGGSKTKDQFLQGEGLKTGKQSEQDWMAKAKEGIATLGDGASKAAQVVREKLDAAGSAVKSGGDAAREAATKAVQGAQTQASEALSSASRKLADAAQKGVIDRPATDSRSLIEKAQQTGSKMLASAQTQAQGAGLGNRLSGAATEGFSLGTSQLRAQQNVARVGQFRSQSTPGIKTSEMVAEQKRTNDLLDKLVQKSGPNAAVPDLKLGN